MYSAEKRHHDRMLLGSKILDLNSSEMQELKKAETIVLSGTQDERFQLTAMLLIDFRQLDKIIKFYFKSPVFKDYCLRDEFGHVARWREILRVLKYSGDGQGSVDQKEKVSVVDQYFGAYFFSEYLKFVSGEKPRSPALGTFFLELACEFGLFLALVRRCENNQLLIKNSRASFSEKREALRQIEEDGGRLGNLYWALGFLHAALVYLDLGNYYASLASDEESVLLGHHLRSKAVKNFLQGKELCLYKSLPENEKIIRTICGKGILEVFDFRSWDKAESYFTEHLDGSRESFDKLRSEARLEIRKQVYGVQRQGEEGSRRP